MFAPITYLPWLIIETLWEGICLLFLVAVVICERALGVEGSD